MVGWIGVLQGDHFKVGMPSNKKDGRNLAESLAFRLSRSYFYLNSDSKLSIIHLQTVP